MTEIPLDIEYLWKLVKFKPNEEQRKAILHVKGPLYLTAGPGSGKTRVLLWRTLNLVAFHDLNPEEIYLSTFTEKAARQLREGLQAMLGTVTNFTGKPFDLSQMYVGTVHSLCQRLISDRRFATGRQRARPPILLDELGQYFHLYRKRNWRDLLDLVGLDPETGGTQDINACFGITDRYGNRHKAAQACMSLFNRLSEECIDPNDALKRLSSPAVSEYLHEQEIEPESLELLIRLYTQYRQTLKRGAVPLTDFSLLQQEAHRVLCDFEGSGDVFKHVIVDEYQDTNTIQERIFFKLAEGTRNICVVGDDDQALYRFRGATVENFVQFPQRCLKYLGVKPRHVPLVVNYRSREPIVDFYSQFMDHCDWSDGNGNVGQFRVTDKELRAHRKGEQTAVVTTECNTPDDCCDEIADLAIRLLDEKVVQDPNQIAFLFPGLKYGGSMNKPVRRMKAVLEERGLKVYAPRAGRFLEVEEATEMLGVLGTLFGRSGLGGFDPGSGGQWTKYRQWLKAACDRGEELVAEDQRLEQYIEDRQAELDGVIADYDALMAVVSRQGWELLDDYDPVRMKRPLLAARGLSKQAKSAFSSVYFDQVVRKRADEGRPASLRYVVRRATTLDWSVLDVFYRVCGMDHFRRMFDLAERGEDEGPICNLALLSRYLARFMDEYMGLIAAEYLRDHLFIRVFLASYLYALWRLGESEYEDEDALFPKGRIPFLSIHQSKGLEFPVVVLANPRKDNRGPQLVEKMVRPFLARDDAEPLDRTAEFDIMRMFYVALSRAENLLVIGQFRGRGQRINRPFKKMLPNVSPICELDLDTVPRVTDAVDDDLPRTYSYTGDYLAHQRCPRQYMIFRKYGFEASQTRTLFFGSLVHNTLDDLHNFLIDRRSQHTS